MIYTNPILYQYLCTTSTSLMTLPLDIAQTKIITQKTPILDINEAKWILLFPIIFTSQNIVYNKLYNIKNIFIRGALAGIFTTPIYTYLETSKIYTRLRILPNYKIYIKYAICRQTIFYAILYKINSFKIPFSTFIAAFISNSIGFYIKLLTLSKSYPIFIINKKTIKLTAILEIIKASISDGTALFLIYTSNFIPLKK